jgi:hypothetical protein
MPLDPTHVRLKLLHACGQWHSSREPIALTVDTLTLPLPLPLTLTLSLSLSLSLSLPLS